MEFKLSAQDVIARVPPAGLSADELHGLIAPFLARLGDGHTSLRPPPRGDRAPSRTLPIVFSVAVDATFVAGAAAEYEDLIGSRLVAVEDASLAQLQARASRILPSENEYGAARYAARALRSSRYTRQLFGDDLDTLRVRLRHPTGAEVERPIPLLDAEAVDPARPNRLWTDLKTAGGAIGWRYLGDRRVGYLRLESIEGREAFEEARGRQDLPDYVAGYYRRYLDREPPADIDSAVAGVPCFTASVADLLSTMRDRGGQHLVVDLRGNGGGWSSLMLPLYLLMYGDEYLDHVFPEVWIDVASPQTLQLNGWTADDLRAAWGAGYEIGDYRRRTAGTPRGGRGTDEYAARQREYRCGLAEWFLRLAGRPLHRPKVVLVLVDSGTFSAAFQAAYHLRQLGAVLVGVPPAQAGNTFTNVIPVELPNSRLRGSVARSAQIYFPGDTAQGRVMRPDYPMTWELYKRYGFDAQSEVQYALDLIAAGGIDAARPRAGGNPGE